MVDLILSLVWGLAGLYFIISGKVKVGTTLYIEGVKARIAGLILFAQLVLMLVLFGGGLVIEMVSETDALAQLLGSLATQVVRNGIMIGLAYIYFHSVSRETKDHKGCLPYWIAYVIILALLVIYFVPSYTSTTGWYKMATIGISVFQVVSVIGIWLWKKWGIWGYVASTMIYPIISFFRAESVSELVVNLIQSLGLILVLYLLAKPKWQFFDPKKL